MIKPIRLIPRHMSHPFFPRLIKLNICLPNRNSNSSIIQQVPDSRVTKPLRAGDPGFWWIAYPW